MWDVFLDFSSVCMFAIHESLQIELLKHNKKLQNINSFCNKLNDIAENVTLTLLVNNYNRERKFNCHIWIHLNSTSFWPNASLYAMFLYETDFFSWLCLIYAFTENRLWWTSGRRHLRMVGKNILKQRRLQNKDFKGHKDNLSLLHNLDGSHPTFQENGMQPTFLEIAQVILNL